MPEIGSISYDRKNLLGEGGFGFVFRGTFRNGDNGEESTVAVKQIQHGNINTDEREVDALKKLRDHPNVIRLYGAEKDGDFHYFALELCAASMHDIFRDDDERKKYRGPLPSDLDALLQLSEGLRYIHGKGFVHRDVKPENVLISYPRDDGTVVMKWSDFGLSKSVSSRGTFSISGVKGTINWIAPEILATLGLNESKPRGTVESDTWSFGCVAFAYLTRGRHPFGDSDITLNILAGNPINLSELPQDQFAGNIIKEMIQKDPADRMKLVDAVWILNEVETSQQHQTRDDNARRELETGQLYSWEQWNFALKGGELFIWSDNVAVQTYFERDVVSELEFREGKALRIRLNGYDKMKISSLRSNGSFLMEGDERAIRKDGELNRGMFAMVGITMGSPSRSPLNAHFVSQGREWTVGSSSLSDNLIVKEERDGEHKWEMVLFGPLFHSALHVTTHSGDMSVWMTDRAKFAMEDELLDLFSRPSLEPKELDRIAALLRVGVDPNCTKPDGKTPLLLCLANQDGESRVKCLRILLEGNASRGDQKPPRKVDLNVQDRQRRNALQLLLDEDADERTDGTLTESLKLLIDGGMDVQFQDESRRTALHLLFSHYRKKSVLDAVKLLIEKGVDANVRDPFGRTALHFLCEHYKNADIAEAVLLLIETGMDLNSRDGAGRTVLYYLCKNNKNENFVKALKLLIVKGVDIKSQDQFGRNALHWLCEYEDQENTENVWKALLDKGLEEDFLNSFARSALFSSQNYKSDNVLKAMELLMEEGVGVNVTDRFQRIPLHYLCQVHRIENVVDVMELFIRNGVDMNLKDVDGRRALDYLGGDQRTVAGYKEKFLPK